MSSSARARTACIPSHGREAPQGSPEDAEHRGAEHHLRATLLASPMSPDPGRCDGRSPRFTGLAWPSLPRSAPIIEEPDTIILRSLHPLLSDWIFFDILP